jgi:hypothetical protein
MHDDELRAQLADWVRPVASLPVPGIRVLRGRARRRQIRRAATAAAITVVVAAAAVGITASLPGSGPSAARGSAATQGGPTWSAAPGTWIKGHWQPAGALPAADAGPASAPYFVAIQPDQGPAVVTDAFTGQVLATVKPGISGASFAGVAAAGDDRTFILAAQDTGFVAFYELRLAAGGRVRSLDVLFILPASTVPVFAVSPDASLLAYTTGTGIEVVSLAQETAASWTATADGGQAAAVGGGQVTSLSWAGDKTVAFDWSAPPASGASASTQPTGAGVRLLDINASGTLQQASRLIMPYCPSGPACTSGPLVISPVITPDGSKVLAGVVSLGQQVTVRILAFSARTGQSVGAVTPRVTVTGHDVVCQPLWSDPSGAQQTAYCELGGTFAFGRFSAADLHLPVSILAMAGQLVAW